MAPAARVQPLCPTSGKRTCSLGPAPLHFASQPPECKCSCAGCSGISETWACVCRQYAAPDLQRPEPSRRGADSDSSRPPSTSGQVSIPPACLPWWPAACMPGSALCKPFSAASLPAAQLLGQGLLGVSACAVHEQSTASQQDVRGQRGFTRTSCATVTVVLTKPSICRARKGEQTPAGRLQPRQTRGATWDPAVCSLALAEAAPALAAASSTVRNLGLQQTHFYGSAQLALRSEPDLLQDVV